MQMTSADNARLGVCTAGASGEVPITPVCVSGVSVTTAEWVSRVGKLHTYAGIQSFPAE